MKKPEKQIHVCDGCGRKRKMAPSAPGKRRHYCDCNPGAPFYMVPLIVKQITAAALYRFRFYPRH